ncbi:MAG: amino acid adenylation domain-containing protein [Acidobacteriota bacterium]
MQQERLGRDDEPTWIDFEAGDLLPLTYSQRPIWIGQRLSAGSPLYNMTFAWVLRADLQVDVFCCAWQRVAERSDALRSRIVEKDGEARVAIRRSVDATQRVALPEATREGFRSWCRERSARPLDPSRSLVDSVLVPLANDGVGWYLNLHHLITDAWSTVVLYRRVAAEYEALLAGVEFGSAMPESAAAEPQPSYYRTAQVLIERAESARPAVRDAARQHWEQRLERGGRAIPCYGRAAEPAGTASHRSTLRLDPARWQALDALCDQPGFTSLSRELSRFALFATLLVSFLHRISGRSELGFDAPIAGRPSADAKRALGLFIEMFPFGVTVERQETFRSLAGKCLEEAGQFLQHARPGSSSLSGRAASNVVLNYFPQAFGEFAGQPAEVEWVHPGHGDTVHALRLQVHDFGGTGGLTLHFDFNERALPERLRQRALQHFEHLLEALLDDPDRRIAGVDLQTPEERHAMTRLNATAGEPPSRTVVERFLACANASPSHRALRQGEDTRTFAELEAQSSALASTLLQAGVTAGDRVAIMARRSIPAVVAVLATLRIGAAYVPIDPAYPRGRRASILRSSAARLLLVGEGVAEQPTPDGVSRVAIVPAIVEGGEAQRSGGQVDATSPGLADLAYILYTSGSTGQPKGVSVEHRGLSSYLEWAEQEYVRGEHMSFPLFTSLSFDLTVTSLFLPLISGGTLEIYPEPEGPVDSALVDVVRADAVDFIKLTPSHLSLFLQMDRGGERIRRMVVGGEDFKTQLASEAHARLGDRSGDSPGDTVEITNEYGPTEAVVGCVAHRFDPSKDVASRVPIGGPADLVGVEILNHAGAPVPEGVAGELWVSRPGLARGYRGLPRRTAESFQPSTVGVGERRYRTGDRVRVAQPGSLEYLGRLDRQVKLSGYRVEPAEIEATLLALPSVEQCAVVARRRDPQRQDPAAQIAAAGEVRHCTSCGLPSDHPRAVFDDQGVCGVCRSYEAIREHAQAYFKTMDDLRELFAESRRARQPADPEAYDCMLLLSGGKDSTYALCRLVEMGLRVYAFSLDNGYISDHAKDNIRRVTQQLGVPFEFGTTPAMNAIFRDSLMRFANVCQGCFKTIYTLGTQRAKQLGIPIIVTGLSRGQMFETRLTEEMFRDGRWRPEEVDAAVLAARKAYHRVDDEVSRSLDVSLFRDDRIFEAIQFVDFYRYCDVDLTELKEHLARTVPWVRPSDTGRSTNCLINDVGIFVHKQQRGFHNYALPYSWDVRMGHKTRDEARAELEDEIDIGFVRRTLAEIGGDVDLLTSDGSAPQLVAYYVATPGEAGAEELSEETLRRQLAEHLPSQLIPAHLHRLEALPLTVHGKVDEAALPRFETGQGAEVVYRAPEGPVEEFLAEVWQQQLGVERVGADDHFFQAGGTSLGAMEVMIHLCQEFDLDLPLETLFAHPTLSKLARAAEDQILADVAEFSEAEQQQMLAGAGVDP